MNFVKCLIFIIWISLAENAPVNETSTSSQGVDITENLTKFLTETFDAWMSNFHPRRFIKKAEFKLRSSEIRTVEHEFDAPTERPVHNITINVNMSAHPKFKIVFASLICPTNVNIFYELGSASLKAYLGNSDQYVESEISPLKVDIMKPSNQPKPGNFTAVIQNLDQIQFKPLDPHYQYKPNEETRVKQAITKYLRELANESVNESIVRLHLSMMVQGIIVRESFTHYYEFKQCDSTPENQRQKWYYSIPNVDGTLSNVTIVGSWDLHSISADGSNQENFLTIQFTDVQGTMLKFKPFSKNSNPTELSFTADRVKAILDIEAGKMKIKFEYYSVSDAKSNTKLDWDESKSIMERIEAAIESKIPTRPPRPEGETSQTPRTTVPPTAENTETNSISLGKTVKQYFSTIFSGFFL